MALSANRPLAIYYEHPDWFRPLFAELERRGTPHVKLDASGHAYDAAELPPPYSLGFNRMSPSAWLRGRAHAVFYTHSYLTHLQRLGLRVINRSRAHVTETSTALHRSLLERPGLPAPRAAAVRHASQPPAIDVAGVEYFTDARDGRLYFYDINALSNFVADAPRVVGFDPFARLVDYLEREAA